MAHVGISQQLISEVKSSITNMGIKERDVKLEQLHVDNPEVDNRATLDHIVPEDLADLKLKLYGEYGSLIEQMPNKWLVSRHNFTVRWKEDAVSHVTGEPCVKLFEYYVLHSSNFKLPPNTSTYDVINVEGRPAVADRFVQYANKKSAILAEVKKKYDNIVDQVTTYLKSCKSLNAAIRALPDIRLYIPQSYLDRVDAKVERRVAESKAEEHAAVVDTSLIVSTAVMHKFLGAQS